MNKIIKKFVSILLCGAMASALMACGDSSTKNTSGNTTSQKSTSQQNTTAESEQELVTIKICLPTLLYTPSEEGTQQTEDAINQYLESKGDYVRVDLQPIDGTNYVTELGLKLTSGEAVDLFCPLSGIENAVSQEQILPLDDYLDNELAETAAILGDYLKAGYVGDHCYAVPCWKEYGLNCYYFYRSDIAEELGFTEDKVQTLDDVEKLLKAVKAAYPDMYGFVPTGGAANAGNTLMLESVLGGPKHYKVDEITSGVGIVGDDMTVVNIYDTDYFREVCETAYRWNQEGLIMPDASFTSELGRDLIQAGRAFSVITGYGSTGQYEDMSEFYTKELGYPIKAVPLDSYLVTSSSCAPSWSISYNCKNPKAAARVLNYLYTDEFVENTVLNGVEGIHYIKNEDGSISLPEGVEPDTSTYYCFISCGIVGNMAIQWQWDEAKPITKTIDQANAESTMSKAFGFAVRADNFATEASAISNVKNKYLYGLICGELNPDDYLPKFISELEAAGINTVIKDVQAQLDEFLNK